MLPVILAVLGVIVVLSITLSAMYKRSSKQQAFVRTGLGGEKVILNGGAMVFPIVHEIISVNMNTIRLLVERSEEQALITQDRMRVDVIAEFYMRVKPTQEAIGHAAQTLGVRTLHHDALKELVEGKFVDALRSVAAKMTMQELHEQRTDFVQKVQQVLSEDLLKNGLELESVSLTGLDQTSMEHFNANNAFDAEGLTKLTQEIESRKKIRNDIEQDNSVQIKNKNLEAEKLKLDILREEEYAKLEQQREIEIKRAEQEAEIVKSKASQEKASEQSKIEASQAVEQTRIVSDRALEQEKINKDKLLETQLIEKQRAIEIASQDKVISVTLKSKEQSLADAQANEAKAEAVKAEEGVVTSREEAVAQRQKQIELIDAAKEAEREAITAKIAAETQKLIAYDQAEALREDSRAKADTITIQAEAESQAEKLRADATQVSYVVEAAGQEAINKAANLLSEQQVQMKIKLELIQNLEAIIRESVKPMENIDSIKIVQVDGMHGPTQSAGTAQASQDGSLSDQIVSSALRYRAQAPLVDSLLKDVGLEGAKLNQLTKSLEEV
tara:strand:+ start:925 stop:2595 length:1671 start_codon:yes stop_codon:yes gene_type:complete